MVFYRYDKDKDASDVWTSSGLYEGKEETYESDESDGIAVEHTNV
jgi:hypothetical protein